MFDLGSSLPGTAPECVAELAELEVLKARIAARQTRVAASLVAATPRASESSQGSEIGLARQESPTRGRALRRAALALVDDFPEVLGLLEAGALSERRAELIVAEGQHLSVQLRGVADREIVRRLAERPGLGDRGIQTLARRVVLGLDDAAAAARRERALADRRVTGRCLGDGTSRLTAIVSDVDAAAIMAALSHHAGSLKAQPGERRSHAQLVTVTFVERLTLSVASGLPITLDLVMPVESLLGDSDEPAELDGLGPVPASVARRLAFASPAQATRIRRLFAHEGRLVAMDADTRLFDGLLRRFVALRDQRCRTPFCDAPIRQVDHLIPAARGGPTSAENGAGRCQACNLLKEEPGWGDIPVGDGVTTPHEIATLTPAGQVHHRRAPDPPGDRTHGFTETEPGVYTLTA